LTVRAVELPTKTCGVWHATVNFAGASRRSQGGPDLDLDTVVDTTDAGDRPRCAQGGGVGAERVNDSLDDD
jgi:hypothetical protein